MSFVNALGGGSLGPYELFLDSLLLLGQWKSAVAVVVDSRYRNNVILTHVCSIPFSTQF